MKKLPYKIFCVSIIFIGFLLIVGNLLTNLILAKSKPFLVKQLEEALHKSIHLENLYFQYPNQFILRNLTIAEADQQEKNRFFNSPECALKFFLIKSLLKQSFIFKEVVIKKADFDPYSFYRFINFDLMPYLKHFGRHDFDIQFENSTFQWFRHAPKLVLQAHISLKHDIVKSKGVIRKLSVKAASQDKNNVPPFSYELIGSFAERGFILKQLVINQKDFRSKLWGHFVDDLLWLNGYCVRTNLSVRQGKVENKFPLLNKLDDITQEQINLFKGKTTKKGTVYLSDMGVLAQFNNGDINIKRLFANFNNVPVVINGNINLQNQDYKFAIDANWMLINGYSGKIQKINALVKGNYRESILSNDSDINLFLKTKIDSDMKLSRLNVKLQDFKVNFLTNPRWLFTLKEIQVKYKNSTVDLSVPFERTIGYVDFVNNVLFNVRLHSHIYNGSLRALTDINLLNVPMATTRLKIKNVHLAELTQNVFNSSILDGLFNSEVVIQSTPTLNAAGHFNLKNVELTNDKMTKEILNYFSLSPGQAFVFKRVSSQITFDGKNIKFPNVNLELNDLKLRGSLVLKDEMTLNSQFSLYLTREFIKNTRYLRPALSALDSKDPVRFDFNVSGYCASPNFQWVDSETKKQIQTRIPDFIERIVEDRIQRTYNKTSVN